MSTFIKISATVICLLFVFFAALGCTPDAKEDKTDLPKNDSVSTFDGEVTTDIGGSFPDSEPTSPEETDPEVVWTPFV